MSERRAGFIRLHNVRPFVQYLKDRHVDHRPAFHALGLDEAVVSDPKASVHAEILYGLLNALAKAAGDPYLGYHVAERLDISDGPIFADVASQSATIGEFFTRYLTQIPNESSSTRHVLIVEAERATYRIVRSSFPNNKAGQADAFGAMRFLRLFQSIAGDAWEPKKVRLLINYPHALPPNPEGIEVGRSKESGLELHFPNSWLYSPLKLDFASERKRRVEGDLASTELSMIVALREAAKPMLLDQKIDPDRLADALGIETKHMIRALALQNTTVPRELKRLRVDLAKEALANSPATIRDIGMSLGYPDSTHFTRFFRSQTSMTPRAYRQQQRKAVEQVIRRGGA